MKQLLILITIALLFPAYSFAQEEETPEELFDDAQFFFVREDYEEAAYLFGQLLKAEPQNDHARFKLGQSFLNIPGQEDKAIAYLEKASQNIKSPNLRFRDRYSEKQAPHHTWFFLGNAYRINNQLEEALEAYEKFMDIKNFEKKYNLRITEEEIRAVGRAKIIQDAPLDLYRSLFDEPINTTGKDYDPVISANEQVMVWMNSQKFYEAIFMSVKQDDKWTNPVNITPQVGSDGDMVPSGLSPDGTALLLVKSGEFDSDIYYSTYDGTFWSKAEPIKGAINSNFTEAHASFFPSGNKILLSSDRRGSVGGLDLFISSKQPDGSWGEPQRIPGELNTEFDETSGHISPDGSKIIFASSGHFNMGDLDIFYADIGEDGSFGRAINIGFPINTTNKNTNFCPVKDGFSGVYAFRDPDGFGQDDIWYIEIVPYEETVAKALTRLSEQDFSITLTDKESGEEIRLLYDSVNDQIKVTSKKGKEYTIVYTRDGK
jgi:hypothetical protein